MEEGKIDELFDSLNPSTSNTESYKLELKKIRKSRTFQLSTIFVKAFEKPWKLPFIPLSIVVLFLKSLFNNTNRIVLEESRFTINNNQDKKDCVVFFPTDEDGFEHFSRS